jgi:hypothetical protein
MNFPPTSKSYSGACAFSYTQFPLISPAYATCDYQNWMTDRSSIVYTISAVVTLNTPQHYHY